MKYGVFTSISGQVINGETLPANSLVEGGFFSRGAAEDASEYYSKDGRLVFVAPQTGDKPAGARS